MQALIRARHLKEVVDLEQNLEKVVVVVVVCIRKRVYTTFLCINNALLDYQSCRTSFLVNGLYMRLFMTITGRWLSRVRCDKIALFSFSFTFIVFICRRSELRYLADRRRSKKVETKKEKNWSKLK